MPILDAHTFPLHGTRLIEASAGTGKTFTIAALYLRLVLGARSDDDAAAFSPDGLLPPQILVVTFTEAATEELRERIRARLADAARAFRAPAGEADFLAAIDDDFLFALRAAYPAGHWNRLARRLDVAAQWMDEAAIHTIHAFCQKMLRTHAFDSRSLFSLTVNTDDLSLRGEAARDYWRRFVYPLDAAQLETVSGLFGQPDALWTGIAPLLPHLDRLPPVDPAVGLDELLAGVGAERRARLDALKAPWRNGWCDELAALLDAGVAAKTLNARSLNSKSRADWMAALRDWADSPDAIAPELSKTAWQRLTPAGLAEITVAGHATPGHAALDALAALPGQLARLPQTASALRAHAARWIAARLEAEKQRRAEIGFDDMISRLDTALAPASPGRDKLAATLRAQFPVAMIDEFQDTDPAQYRIFRTVYAEPPAGERTGFFMIGDPKQAIYAFRGADIFTYLQARRDAGEARVYTLHTNYRSTGALVAAVNHVFATADRALRDAPPLHQEDRGASEAAAGIFLYPGIPFDEVAARGRKETLLLDGKPAPALTLWRQDGDDDGLVRKSDYQLAMAAAAASRIVAVLNGAPDDENAPPQQARPGEGAPISVFRAEGQRDKPVRPRDIAVLVRDRFEARLIRDELDRRGVRSVYLSDKDSVFASQEAADLLRWLEAAAFPEDGRRVRAALATITLATPLAELDRLAGDELAWEDAVERFRDYRRQWQQQGVLPMLRQLMRDEKLPQRLLARADRGGERALTNLLHLAERLQADSQHSDGELGLIRHLAGQIHAPGNDSVLRLESEAELVRVVTIHKSKGLEYPLVFLPFLCGFKPVDFAKLKTLSWHDGDGELQLDLSNLDEAGRQACQRERLAEDIRLVYVALTRARHALWVGTAPLASGSGKNRACRIQEGGLGCLLGAGRPLDEASLAERLDQLAATLQSHPGAIVVAAPDADDTRWQPRRADAVLLPARRFSGRIGRDWWVSSYTALLNNMQGGAGERPVAGPDNPIAAVLGDENQTDSEQDIDTPLAAAGRTLHDFYRGPKAGVFLHGLLEWAATAGFARAAADGGMRQDMLARRCQRRTLTGWIGFFDDWLPQLLRLPLPLPDSAAPVVLADLSPRAARAEMEFWLGSERVPIKRIDALVSQSLWPGAARPQLAPAMLNGMFKGFIDLVFEHEGRFYVADYKSNWLGPDAAYTLAAMRHAMLEHRYDLQGVLYTLALHRLLKHRLGPRYDYGRHVGGFVYLFLRGLDERGRGMVCEHPPQGLIEALDALFAHADHKETDHAG